MVRLACEDRGNARARRRAAWLRACAISALAVQPALASPVHDTPGAVNSATALADHGPVVPRLEAVRPDEINANPNNNGNGPPSGPGNGNAPPAQGADLGPATGTISANSGTFDIAITPPPGDAGAKDAGDSNGKGNKPDLPPPTADLLPTRSHFGQDRGIARRRRCDARSAAALTSTMARSS